jgi:hypothetical protein
MGMDFTRQPYRPSVLVDTFCITGNFLLVAMLSLFVIKQDHQIQKFSDLIDRNPLSAYELPAPLDLEIREVQFRPNAPAIKIIPTRPVPIGPEHFRDPAIETRLHYEPGGWIADDVPIQKGESVHPKGIQPALPGSEPDTDGGTKIRDELKSWASPADLANVVPTRDRTGDRE